jgi:hypothetical protein
MKFAGVPPEPAANVNHQIVVKVIASSQKTCTQFVRPAVVVVAFDVPSGLPVHAFRPFCGASRPEFAVVCAAAAAVRAVESTAAAAGASDRNDRTFHTLDTCAAATYAVSSARPVNASDPPAATTAVAVVEPVGALARSQPTG